MKPPAVERSEQLQLDSHLQQMAIAAQKYPYASRARHRALSELISTILRSHKLCRPRCSQFQGLYEEIYAEALQRLFSFVCERIDDYSAEKGNVLQWVNFLLNRRFFIEASRDILPTGFKGIDGRSVKRLSLDQLDSNNPNDLNFQLAPSLSEAVKACIVEDPEGLFKQACVVDHPGATFQYIAIRRLEGDAWTDLSAELTVSVPTLSSFYRRCLARFSDKLKDYVSG